MIDELPSSGAYICGMNMEGAAFNVTENVMCEVYGNSMFFPMPVIQCKAILAAKMEERGIFSCPVYQTQQRGPTYVFNAPLKSKHDSKKWTLAGAVMIMDFVE